MNKLEHALALAAEGFHVFPLEPSTKLPAIDEYPKRATRDPEQIKRWWTCPITGFPLDRNIAISTTRYQDDAALLVVDIDNKGASNGNATVSELEAQSLVLPATRTTRTPTGGRHLFYRVPVAVRQGAHTLGRGVDTRSFGGYVVAAGSNTGHGEYPPAGNDPVVGAPAWLTEKIGSRRNDSGTPAPLQPAIAERINPARAERRAIEYLQSLKPAGAGERNHKGFAAAAKLKDFGVAEWLAAGILEAHWKCDPPLDPAELNHVVRSAYKYGREIPGSDAPEVQFDPVGAEPAASVPGEHPFEKLNQEFAFVIAGGGHHILWETNDARGNPSLEHLTEAAFHKRHASHVLQLGKSTKPVTDLWMTWKGRRSFDGLCFMPGELAPPRFYNMWRGFSVPPAKTGKHESVDMFVEHAFQNVCHRDEALFQWLMGFFAHMVQKPGEKPLVALVFRGSKGVGKNALIERVGHLLGSHFLVTADRRYLVGNFNGHLENMLFLALDEAFWSGDKQVEGVLKNLVTGSHHVIEHKGKEPFKVDNKTRVAVIGNEDWIVPASHDERRYAVFDVGEGRKQDRAFFQQMREGMERGGYRNLLRYLLDFDIGGLDFNEAPSTKGLLEQKHASLEPVEQWWFQCLQEERLVGSDFDGWPERLETKRVMDALRRYYEDRRIKNRVPDSTAFGKAFSRCAPAVERRKGRVSGVDAPVYAYFFPTLAAARGAWERHIGHREEWDK